MDRLKNYYAYVIVGNSAAAIKAVEAIRRRDRSGKIMLISREDCRGYSPVLTTYYIAQKLTREELFFVEESFYQRYNLDTRLGEAVSRVEPAEKIVVMENGEQIFFDKLLLAAGSSPKKLEVEGGDLPEVQTLKSIYDADRILKYSKEARDIVVMGGGLIGLQTANALLNRGRNITLVIGSYQILSQNVDQACAALLAENIRDQGVKILFGHQVQRIEKEIFGLKVDFAHGSSIKADLVVAGKGIQPNAGLVENSGIQAVRGILVDESMRTNYPYIYAAGDVAEGPSIFNGEKVLIPNWLNACRQGYTAGTNMAGGLSRYFNLPENVSTIFGQAIGVLGLNKSRDMVLKENSYINENRGVYRNIICNEEGRLAGAVLLQEVNDIGILANMMKNAETISLEYAEQLARRGASVHI